MAFWTKRDAFFVFLFEFFVKSIVFTYTTNVNSLGLLEVDVKIVLKILAIRVSIKETRNFTCRHKIVFES